MVAIVGKYVWQDSHVFGMGLLGVTAISAIAGNIFLTMGSASSSANGDSFLLSRRNSFLNRVGLGLITIGAVCGAIGWNMLSSPPTILFGRVTIL